MEIAARPRDILDDRTKPLQSEQLAVNQLSSLVLAFQFEANRFASESLFQSKAVNSSNTDVLDRGDCDRRQSGGRQLQSSRRCKRPRRSNW